MIDWGAVEYRHWKFQNDYIAMIRNHQDIIGDQNRELLRLQGKNERLRAALKEIADGCVEYGAGAEYQDIARKALAESQ